MAQIVSKVAHIVSTGSQINIKNYKVYIYNNKIPNIKPIMGILYIMLKIMISNKKDNNNDNGNYNNNNNNAKKTFITGRT